MREVPRSGQSTTPPATAATVGASSSASSADAAITSHIVGPSVVEERPPPGLSQGRYAWPAWGVVFVGGAFMLLGLTFLVLRLRRRWRR
jgi:hypothetical protein